MKRGEAIHRLWMAFLKEPLWLLLALTLSCVGAAVATALPIFDVDVWWVAAAGREQIQGGALLRENRFSFIDGAHPWLMHEWLLGVPYAFGLTRFGPLFFNALALAQSVAGYALIVAVCAGRASRFGAGLALACAALLCFGARMLSARPSSLALLFPLAELALAFAPRFGFRQLVGCLLIELTWANTHGSFPLGVALLALAAFEAQRERGLRALAAAGAAFTTLLNPHGIRLHAFVLSYLAGQSDIYAEIRARIEEFKSFFAAFGSSVGWVDAAGLAFVVALALSGLSKPRHRARAAFALGLTGLALVQARHSALAGLLGMGLLAPLWDELCAPYTNASGYTPVRRRVFLIAMSASSLAVGIGMLALRSGRPQPSDSVPVGAAFFRALERVPADARLFLPFREAGLAIWYAYPRGVRVFYDSRNDCYSPSTSRVFFALSGVSPAPLALSELRSGPTTHLLIPRGYALAARAESAGFSELSDDAGWVLFARRPAL